MTTTTLATGTMNTAARPGRSIEDLVDRLMKTLFSADSETAAPTPTPTPGARDPRGTAVQSDEGDRRGAFDARRHGHVRGGDVPDTVGLHRVEATGQTAVRRQGRTELDPSHRQGRSTRSPPR